MKTKILTIAVCIGTFFSISAQSTSSIAVATPSVQGLFATPEIVSKLINLELIKINKYNVYDEYDMAEVLKNDSSYTKNCFGLNCLTQLGSALKVDFIICGSIDRLGQKIVVSLKIIDIKTKSIYKTAVKEFDNQEIELQRMIEITIREMHDLTNQKELADKLMFKNEVITSNNVGRINNSGPRIGYAYLTGTLSEFTQRSEDQGGLALSVPSFSMIGYQFEKQYIGTENFSALFETIINISGLEHSSFIPTLTFMNGFRFGKKGWEIAFGPSFGIEKTSKGFFDKDNTYGKGEGYYWSKEAYNSIPKTSTPGVSTDPKYAYTTNLDTRGDVSISTKWVMGFGRTFTSGGLNIPVNIFYSSVKNGGMIGASIGFNVISKKENINKSPKFN